MTALVFPSACLKEIQNTATSAIIDQWTCPYITDWAIQGISSFSLFHEARCVRQSYKLSMFKWVSVKTAITEHKVWRESFKTTLCTFAFCMWFPDSLHQFPPLTAVKSDFLWHSRLLCTQRNSESLFPWVKHFHCLMRSEVSPQVWVQWSGPGSGKRISGCAQRPRGRWAGRWRTESRQIWWFPRSQDDTWEEVKVEIIELFFLDTNKYIKYISLPLKPPNNIQFAVTTYKHRQQLVTVHQTHTPR